MQLPPLELLVASGDEQYGTASQPLGNPLRVMVRTLVGELPQSEANIVWEVLSGDASILGTPTSSTDSTGSAEIRLQLGTTPGEIVVQATAQSVNNPMTTFRAFLVDRPQLFGVEPDAGPPGTSIVLSGSNFSPDPAQNVVLFSGIRALVTSASPTELTVTIPACLPQRSVSVSVQLGVVASTTVPFSVGAGGDLVALPVGGVLDVADDAGFTCLGLPGGGEYLAFVYSASTVGAAKHPYSLSGVGSAAPLLSQTGVASARPHERASFGTRAGASRLGDADPQSMWDRRLRELETEMAESRDRTRPRGPAAGPQLAPQRVVPVVGGTRVFNVFDGAEFTEVTAVARLVSDEAALFVDEDAPAGGFTPQDLQLFADRFDRVIHPGVTGAFGDTSDLDDNQRIVILFSPRVNALTPRGASGFVGGFFFGVDLLPERAGSNAAEIFFALVPDPSGIFSDARSRQAVMEVTPAVLAHEFQHMVNFNERVLELESEGVEAIWLSEGMAQYAEEVVALEYDAVGDAASAALFRSGTRARVRRYLQGTDTVSLIISTGQGSLSERGAGFLFVTYLEDQIGGDLLRRLTRTTRTGVGNVEAEVGRDWADVLADWWSAVYLDGPDPESGPLLYPDFDLRGFLNDPFPLEPVQLGAGDFARSGLLWSSSSEYYIVVPETLGSTTVRVAGEAGAPSSRQAALRMRVIRIS